MPSKHEDKLYVENSFYHIYNRGVEKRTIFLDQQDYSTFLAYLKVYLSPKDEKELQLQLADPTLDWHTKDRIIKILQLNNFYDILELVAYCLMPNHFHLLVYQKESTTIDSFMNSMATRYSMFFNRKYKRVGPLFQGTYKAVLIETDEQLIHLSRYIHQQALNIKGDPLHDIKEQPSSYQNYLGKIKQEWVKPGHVLEQFDAGKLSSLDDVTSYQKFVEGFSEYSDTLIHKLTLD